MKAQPTLSFPKHARIRFTVGFAAIAVYLSGRMGISGFEIKETKTKRLGRVFLPVLAMTVLCLISVSTVRASQRFAASLTGAQETPPNASTGTGYGSVILSDDQTQIIVNLGFTGLGTNASAAHIHTGAPGVAGGITFPLAGVPAATSGTFPQQTFAITPSQVTDLLSGNMYFNIHSGGFPGGEIRGQILLATCNTAGPIEVEATAGTFGPTAYATLKEAFDAINTGTHQGAINIEVCGNTTETATASLSASGSGPTYTSLNVYPLGSARTVTGSIVGAIIKLNGADGVLIDGSLSGGTDRSLTITNGNADGFVIWITSASASNGADNNTVKNCNISGNTGVIAIAGILSGSGVTPGNDAEFPNNNNTIQNNAIFRVQNSLFLRGNSTSLDQNWLVTGNTIGSTVAVDKLQFRGMFIGNSQTFSISGNTIKGVASTTTTTDTMSGIQVALNINGGTISGNQFSDIKQTNTDGWGSNGILLAASTTASNLTVSNNFVSDVASQGFNGVTSQDNGYGIMIDSGGGYKIYHNTVSLGTNQVAALSITAAINIASAVTTAGSIDLRDNIFADTQTVGTRYGVYDASTAGAAIFASINYNDYFAQNVGFLTSARATLGDWQTATGQDANSLAVDPLLVSSTDLHLQPTSTLLSVGTSPALVSNDIDNDPRPANPDIGADELVQAVGGSIPGGTYYNASAVGGDSLGGNVTVTNVLYLAGIFSTGANRLTIDCNGFVSGAGASNYVIGNLARNYCATGGKAFDVGTANGYSPVNANATAGNFPATLTIKATQGAHPNVNASTSIQRYWTLNNAGLTSANLTFQYLLGDVMGTEASYKVIRVSGGTSVAFPASTVDTMLHTASLTGVTGFSDWTVGQITAPTAAPATISGRVTTSDGSPFGGATIFLSGNASARTFTNGDGQYRFENVPTEAFYTVTPALVNYSFTPASRSFSLLGNQTDVGFTANATAPTDNPLNVVDFFVRQQYLDFLGREPDMGGWLYWTSQISACGNNQLCINQRRIDVSAAFFASEEFQQTGSFIYRLYQTGLGRQLSYGEFTVDRPRVLAGPDLEENRAAFALEFVTRPEFTLKYQNATTAEGFVDALLATVLQSSGLDLSAQRDALIAEYSEGADMNHSRSRVLRTLADNSAITDAAYNPSFVLMEYFGYLRRDIDQGGYEYWLEVLNNGAAGNYRGMVCAFLTSTEYQLRFSPIVTHSNAECGP